MRRWGSTRWAEAWIAYSARRAALLLGVGALVALLGALGAVRLYSDLRPDLSELLPTDARSARDVAKVTERVGGWAELTVALHGPDPATLREAADALAPRLLAIPDLVHAVEYRMDEVARFYRARRWLFPSLEELRSLRQVLSARVRWELQKGLPLLRPASAEPPDVGAVVEKIRANAPGASLLQRFPDGYFLREVTDPRGQRTHALLMRVRLSGNPEEYARVAGLNQAVRQVAAAYQGEHPGAPVQVSYGGYVASTVFEHDGLAEDLAWASAAVFLLIGLAISLYFGTPKALVALGVPLGVGTLAAFGAAELLVGHLNSNTAFLGSIVVGNGINVGLILFARYAEERRTGSPPPGAITTAVRDTWLGTLTAALGAGVAYGSLAVTDFRGFAQFGLIGGVGMALCWLATYALTPALVLFWERRGTLIAANRSTRTVGAMDGVARLSERHPRAVLLGAVLLALPATVFAVKFLRDPIEYDFGKLRDVRALDDGGPQYWEDAVFGGHHDPAVLLTRDAGEARQVAQSVEAHRARRPQGTVGQVISIASFVPADQEAKLEVLRDLKAFLTPEVLALAPEEVREQLAGELPPDDLRPFGPSDLPPLLKRRLTERDGTVGTPVLVYPSDWVSVWNGRHALLLADELRALPMPRPDLPMASSLLVFADVLAAMVRDGPLATAVSFLGVAALVVVLFVSSRGRRGLADAARVLATVCGGVFLFLAAAGVLGLKLTLLSFIALPITFGIGVDYAVNVVQRQRATGASFAEALRTTGSTVVLCSFTTVVGYSSLLLAHNQALRTFGLLANLGEISCLISGLVLLPAFSQARRTSGS